MGLSVIFLVCHWDQKTICLHVDGWSFFGVTFDVLPMFVDQNIVWTAPGQCHFKSLLPNHVHMYNGENLPFGNGQSTFYEESPYKEYVHPLLLGCFWVYPLFTSGNPVYMPGHQSWKLDPRVPHILRPSRATNLFDPKVSSIKPSSPESRKVSGHWTMILSSV